MNNCRSFITAAVFMALLTGCRSDLPFYITIDQDRTSDPAILQPDPEDACVLGLGDIVKRAALEMEGVKTLRAAQMLFERRLGNDVRNLRCKGEEFSSFTFRNVASKWMDVYSSDPSNPAYGLDRLREILSSKTRLSVLQQRPILPEEGPRNRISTVETTEYEGSAWCGNPRSTQCQQKRTIFKSIPISIPAPGKRGGLFVQVLDDIDSERDSSKRSALGRSFALLGYEIPWDRHRTAIRYGVVFYFEVRVDYPPELIGYELLYASEATPLPASDVNELGDRLSFLELVRKYTVGEPDPVELGLLVWRTMGYPFSVIVGVKNAALELTKLPMSLAAGVVSDRSDPWSSGMQVVDNAKTALAVETTEQTRRGPLWGLYRLVTEVPVVGQLIPFPTITIPFDWIGWSVDREEDVALRGEQVRPTIFRHVFLSRGIYGGDISAQDTGLWFAATRAAYQKGYAVYAPPYRHGTITDVVWSMLNLSHGPAYDEARYVMEHSSLKHRVYLAGHSGGVQRSAVTSRILFYHGYKVTKIFGIAGPVMGPGVVKRGYREPFKVYLNTGSGTDQDLVSKIGLLAARLFSNATVIELDQKSATRHRTPMRLSFAEGVLFDGFVRDEFESEFREDLEISEDEMFEEYDIPWRRN